MSDTNQALLETTNLSSKTMPKIFDVCIIGGASHVGLH